MFSNINQTFLLAETISFGKAKELKEPDFLKNVPYREHVSHELPHQQSKAAKAYKAHKRINAISSKRSETLYLAKQLKQIKPEVFRRYHTRRELPKARYNGEQLQFEALGTQLKKAHREVRYFLSEKDLFSSLGNYIDNQRFWEEKGLSMVHYENNAHTADTAKFTFLSPQALYDFSNNRIKILVTKPQGDPVNLQGKKQDKFRLQVYYLKESMTDAEVLASGKKLDQLSEFAVQLVTSKKPAKTAYVVRTKLYDGQGKKGYSVLKEKEIGIGLLSFAQAQAALKHGLAIGYRKIGMEPDASLKGKALSLDNEGANLPQLLSDEELLARRLSEKKLLEVLA